MTAITASPASAVTPGIITTVAGGDAPGPAPATNVAIGGPSGLAVHGGSVYVTDDQFHVVRKVASDGSETVVAGNGTQGSFGDGGPATEAEFNDPKGVAVDANGNIAIADLGNNVVRIVFAGTGDNESMGTGTAGYSGDGGSGDAAEFSAPGGVAIDSAGNVVIADTYNNAIRVFANQTGTFYGVAMTFGDIYTIAGGNGSG